MPVMVATDVASRGLDVRGICAVVNYDLANTTEDYVHRIGRTGPAGQQGESFTFITRAPEDTVEKESLFSATQLVKMINEDDRDPRDEQQYKEECLYCSMMVKSVDAHMMRCLTLIDRESRGAQNDEMSDVSEEEEEDYMNWL